MPAGRRGPHPAEGELASLLRGIEAADEQEDYAVRNAYVYQALGAASRLGYPVGVRLDPAEPGWPVAYIELPTGQVSWHLPAFAQAWDGHTIREKYARCRAYAEGR